MSYTRKTSYQRIAGLICTAALVGGGLLAPAAHYVFMFVSPLYAMSDDGPHRHGQSDETDSRLASDDVAESEQRAGSPYSDRHRNDGGIHVAPMASVVASQQLSDSGDASHRPCEYAALYASAAASIAPAGGFGIAALPALPSHIGVGSTFVENLSLHCFGPRGPPVIRA